MVLPNRLPPFIVAIPSTMKSLTQILTVALYLLTLQTHASPTYLEWQLPHLTNRQSNLKTRFSATPEHPDTLLTGEKQIQLISQPHQHFVICAEYVAYDTPAIIIPLEDGERQTYRYQLVTTEQETTLGLLHPSTCAVDSDTYPYHFLGLLHSEKPFLAIQGRLKDNNKKENSSGGGLPPSQPQPSVFTFSSGGGFGLDDDQQYKKCPPWVPFQTSAPYSLMLLPILKLPEELRNFLPNTGFYYDLMEQLGYGEEINIVLRVEGNEPVNIPLHRSEREELVKHMANAPTLMNWLAPRLNGREELVSWLLDIQTYSGEDDTAEEKEFLEAVEKQLSIVLEQSDTEFSLELETYSLMAAVADANQSYSEELVPTSRPDTKTIYDGTEVAAFVHQYGQKQSKGTSSSCDTNYSDGEEGDDNGAQRNLSGNQKGDNSGRDDLKPNAGEDNAGDSNTVPIVFKVFGGNSGRARIKVANGIIGFNYFSDSRKEPYINPEVTFVVQVLDNKDSSNNKDDRNANVVLIDLKDQRYLNEIQEIERREKPFPFIYICLERLKECVDQNSSCSTINIIHKTSETEAYKPAFTPLYIEFDDRKESLIEKHLISLWGEVQKLYLTKLPDYLKSQRTGWSFLGWPRDLKWRYRDKDKYLKIEVLAEIITTFKFQEDINSVLVRAGLKSNRVVGKVSRGNALYRLQADAAKPYGQLINALRSVGMLPACISVSDLTICTGYALTLESINLFISGMHDPVILTINSIGGAWHALLLFHCSRTIENDMSSFFCLHITNGDSKPCYMSEEVTKIYLQQKEITGAISVKGLMRAYNVDYDIHKKRIENLYRELASSPWETYEPEKHNCMTFCMKIFEETNLDITGYMTDIHSPQLIILSLSQHETHLSSLFCYNSWPIRNKLNKDIIPEFARDYVKEDNSSPGGIIMKSFAFIKGCGSLAVNICATGRHCLGIACCVGGTAIGIGMGILYFYDSQVTIY